MKLPVLRVGLWKLNASTAISRSGAFFGRLACADFPLANGMPGLPFSCNILRYCLRFQFAFPSLEIKVGVAEGNSPLARSMSGYASLWLPFREYKSPGNGSHRFGTSLTRHLTVPSTSSISSDPTLSVAHNFSEESAFSPFMIATSTSSSSMVSSRKRLAAL
jgi:hypothetical protein